MEHSKKLKIGIIGHGHLGKHLEATLKQQGYEVHSSQRDETGNYNNQEIAGWADKIILTVRPSQIDAVITDIRGRIKVGAEVISFAAAYPLAQLKEGLNAPVARAMTDLENSGGSLYRGSEEAFALLQDIALHSSTVEKEKAIDDATVGFACFPGIVAYVFETYGDAANQWLNGYIDYLEREKGIDRRITEGIRDAVWHAGHFEEKRRAVSTGKGITASMIHVLESGVRDYEKVFKAGKTRIYEIVDEILQK